jgi:hypothetical protein
VLTVQGDQAGETTVNDDVMTDQHPEWRRFLSMLDAGAKLCEGHGDQAITRAALATIDGVDIGKSIDWLESEGGHCPCEVIMNIAVPRDEGKVFADEESA